MPESLNESSFLNISAPSSASSPGDPAISRSGSHSINPKLSGLLDGLRQRVRRYIVIDSLLAIAAVILIAFWIGWALDYLPVRLGGTEMPAAARAIYLLVALAIVGYLIFRHLFTRLSRPLPDDSLALLVERHHPGLGGRLVTAVQLMGRESDGDRSGDSHDPKMLARVHREAVEKIDSVDPARVFRAEPLVRKAIVVVPLALLAIGFVIANPSNFARAASRLTLLSSEPWPRKAELKMVGVELPVLSIGEEVETTFKMVSFEDQTVRLPRGSSGTLRITARADETAEVPATCTVYFRTDSGTRGQANMRRIGRVRDGVQAFVLDGPPLAALDESMTFSVHGLDDRLSDYRIEAVDPPSILSSTVEVRYPDYLRIDGAGSVETGGDDANDQVDRRNDYQSGLRVREGSDVTMIVHSDTPLGGADAYVSIGGGDFEKMMMTIGDSSNGARKADGSPDNSNHDVGADDQPGSSAQVVIESFSQATSIQLVPRDRDGIAAQAPYRYFLGIVRDQPPELEMRLDGIGSAVTSRARIPITISARDDYGLADLTITTSAEYAGQGVPGKGNSGEAAAGKGDPVVKAIVERPSIDREGNGSWTVDLRDFADAGKLPSPVPGSTLMLAAEATDRYDLDGSHVTKGELFRLSVVTDDQLLALLERQELGLRARLEQTIIETMTLRDTLATLKREIQAVVQSPDQPASSPDTDGDTVKDQESNSDNLWDNDGESGRSIQVIRLRVQQGGLQATKTHEELSGIVVALESLFNEMVNNRVDSVDRQKRLRDDVRAPLVAVVDGPLAELQEKIKAIDSQIAQSGDAAGAATESVNAAEKTLLELNAVLEKMLDLESYNEILDLFRGLIEDQDSLLEDTKSEQKKKVLDLFQ